MFSIRDQLDSDNPRVKGQLKRHSVSQKLNGTHTEIKCGFREDNRSCPKNRCKRYAFYQKAWPYTEITYRIGNWPSNCDIKSKSKIRQLFKEAFQLWSDVSPLIFREVGKNEIANTTIMFMKLEHGDNVHFDGPLNTLAHAYHLMGGYGELNGDIHFDDDEKWTWKAKQGRNLFIVAAHEIGHVIGLAHSKVKSALMWEHYQLFQNGYTLSEDDVKGIQRIYGKPLHPSGIKGRTVVRSKVTKPTDENPVKANNNVTDAISRTAAVNTLVKRQNKMNNTCDRSIDGLAVYRREIMIFKGNRIWRMKTDGTLISRENGELAASYWYGLPSDIDAVYQRNTDNALIFVKDQYSYIYLGPHQLPIKTMHMLNEMPIGVDAIVAVSGSNKIYIFKNKLVWKADVSTNKLEDNYPRKISKEWKRLPRGINAAYYLNDHFYFFRNGQIYKSKSGTNYVTRHKQRCWQTINRFIKKC
ncbi:stromelysin-3-like [Anneissia japonica]|uniref:stromelysin-3-like n=1 Tax=Anneissia japonica TaxID=1529436 RepID=UPI001425704A|nr:stromelysin-3-like [Anneissia japonica]